MPWIMIVGVRKQGSWVGRTRTYCRISKVPKPEYRVSTIMLTEKCADLILGNDPLPPLNVPVYRAPDYEAQQR